MDYIERTSEILRKDDASSIGYIEFKEGFSTTIDGICENKNEALEESNSHFQKESALLNYIAASLGCLTLSIMDSRIEDNVVLSKEFPTSDWKLSCHITNIVNTLLAIKELCLIGFDTQARSLVRTLDERIYQTLILFSSKDDYEKWKKSESAKQAHFELFSKKKLILKKIKKLDDKYLNTNEHEAIFLFREEDSEYYSDCIHGAHVSVIVGSLAYPFSDIENGPFISSLFGRSSSCSFQTLHHVIGQMAYFSHMLHMVLSDLHSIQSIKNSDYISLYRVSQKEILRFAAELLLGKDFQEFSGSGQ